MSTRSKTHTEEVAIGMSAKDRATMVDSLNGLLADLSVLYAKTRHYHWNLEGTHFFTLHVEFEKLYRALIEDTDAVAERARALGGFAAGSMAQHLELTTLKEATGVPVATAMVSDLCNDYEKVISSLRKKIDGAEEAHDFGTADFFTGLMETYEKTAWMLRSYVR
jgi:starvation-inducible DNA-binding protein